MPESGLQANSRSKRQAEYGGNNENEQQEEWPSQ